MLKKVGLEKEKWKIWFLIENRQHFLIFSYALKVFKNNILSLAITDTPAISTTATSVVDNKNVVSIFGESGIEVDNKLLDATVSDRMILGLVDKSQIEDNISDIVESSNASVSSLLSNAETVKMREVTREKDTQTMSYKDRVHEKRIRCQQQQQQRQQEERVGKSKSASFIKRQPFTCKIPPLTGIGARMNDERIIRILKFITHRSYQQGGFVYPRNLLEDECPNLTEWWCKQL